MEHDGGDTATGAEAMAVVPSSRTDRHLYIAMSNRHMLDALLERDGQRLIIKETTWEKILKKDDIPSFLFVISGSGFTARSAEVMEMINDKLPMKNREFQVVAVSMCTTDVPKHSYVPTMLDKYGPDYHVCLHYWRNHNTLHDCDCNRSVLKDTAFSAILDMLPKEPIPDPPASSVHRLQGQGSRKRGVNDSCESFVNVQEKDCVEERSKPKEPILDPPASFVHRLQGQGSRKRGVNDSCESESFVNVQEKDCVEERSKVDQKSWRDEGMDDWGDNDIGRLEKEIGEYLGQLKSSTSQTEINLLLVTNCKEMSPDKFGTMVLEYFGNRPEDMDQGLKIFSSGMQLKIHSVDASTTDISKDERLLSYPTTGSGPAQKTLQIVLFLLEASTLKHMDEIIKTYASKIRKEDPKAATAVFVLNCEHRDITTVFSSEPVRDIVHTAEDYTSLPRNRIFPLVRYAEKDDRKFCALFLASMKHVFNDLRSKHKKIK